MSSLKTAFRLFIYLFIFYCKHIILFGLDLVRGRGFSEKSYVTNIMETEVAGPSGNLVQLASLDFP